MPHCYRLYFLSRITPSFSTIIRIIINFPHIFCKIFLIFHNINNTKWKNQEFTYIYSPCTGEKETKWPTDFLQTPHYYSDPFLSHAKIGFLLSIGNTESVSIFNMLYCQSDINLKIIQKHNLNCLSCI